MINFKIKKVELEKCLNLYKNIISNFAYIKDKERILLRGSSNQITFIGGNFNISYRTICKYSGDNFTTVIHYSTLCKAISIFNKMLDFTIENEFCTISEKDLKCTLHIPKGNSYEYKFYDATTAEYIIPIDSNIIKSFKKAVDFTSKDEFRPVLTRVLLELDNNKINVISSDAYHIYIGNHKINFQGETRFMLYNEGIETLDDEDCNLYLFESSFQIIGSKKCLQGKLAIDEKFPDINNVIPSAEDYVGKIGFNRTEMINALVKLNSLTDRNNHVVLEIIDEQLHLRCNVLEENILLDIAIQAGYFGNVFKFGHDINRLLFILNSMNENYIYLNLSGKDNTPVVYTCKNETRLLMPVNLAL